MVEPEFSVIIPAYNVQGYLRQAVMSVSSDERTEVLIVDDRSTDGTAALADELESLHETVRVIRPPANVGLGRARNLGLTHARGQYVLFLDGDDYLTADALDRLRAALGSGAPDLVMFGYKRLYPNGDAVEGIQRAPLQIEGPFTAAEHPEILDVLNVAWNKAYRREFLEEQGIEFPVGYYEDIPWTYPLVAIASSIVTIDEPLYLYRQRWSGSILRSVDARHVEIVDQFERLMDVMERIGVSDRLRGEVYTRAFHNLVTLATTKRERIPEELRRDYYTRARQAVRAHRPHGYELPSSGTKWRLMRQIWNLDYSAFSARVGAKEAVKSLRSMPRSVAGRGVRTLRAAYRPRRFYEWHRRVSAIESDLVVLENLWGRSPRLNCLAIDAEIRRTHPDKRLVWSVSRAAAADVPPGMEFVVKGTPEHYRALATAKYFFLDCNLPGWWRKRQGQVFTQLHHGTPLKLMGVEERGQDRAWMNGLLSRSQYWDYSVVSSPYCAEVWKHSYPVKCETLEYGYPRNDVLVAADDGATAEARARLGLAAEGRVILYMPTFRERTQDSISVEDINLVAEGLAPGDVLLTRGHYMASRNAGVELHAAVIDMTEHPAVEDLYLASDVLVTDYSSAMFDYANLGRPIVIFPYDWDEYRQNRGTYFDITVDSPGAVVFTAEELAQVLASRSYADEQNGARLQRFAATFCAFESGHAAADVVARVIGGEEPRKPSRGGTPPVTTWHMERLA